MPRRRAKLPRCEWLTDGSRCEHETLGGKTLCESHEWLRTQDPAWRDLLDHVGRLVAREYVAMLIGENKRSLGQ